MPRSRRVRRAGGTLLAASALIVALAACTPTAPMPQPTPPSESMSGAPTPSPTPTIVPDGTAAQNKPYFDQVNRATIAEHGKRPKGRQFIAGLVAAGYDKADMELTPDTTSVNLPADSIQFSIRFGETCLIGQSGIMGYHSFTGPVISNGQCLLGTARPAG